uniref:Nattererin-1 n=1 Tax=Physalaemus nattereri TaxID=248869 RepID=NTN1_PHYNA|nr:RecName: Full=Nattererin-1 [Physalaemus nattereri]
GLKDMIKNLAKEAAVKLAGAVINKFSPQPQ